MSRLRLGLPLLAGSMLALGAIGPAAARTAGYGGTITVGLFNGLPPTLDPTLSTGGVSATVVFRSFCESLYDLDGKGRIVPQLAAALPAVSKHKLTYTITLRKGALFNDGTPLDSQAVVTSLQRHMTLPGSQRASLLSAVGSVTPAGPLTVVIHLSSRYAPLPSVLAGFAGMIMSPAQLAKAGVGFATSPVCVGPFTFDHQAAGDNVTVIKSPYYYGKYAVHLDKVVFKPALDVAAAVAALQAGDFQALDNLAPTQLAQVQQASSLRLLVQEGIGIQDLFVNIGNKRGTGNLPYTNLGTPLASNPRLRKAFEEAIDRAAMVKVVGGGMGQPGCTPMATTSPWFDETVACTRYDPSDAKKLLAAAGVSNLTVHLLVSNGTQNLQTAQFIQAEEAAVGINVVIDTAPDGGTAMAWALTGNFDVFLLGHVGSTDPDNLVYGRFDTDGASNVSGYSNPRLDLILANGRKATSDKARRTLYHAALQIILADRPAIYLWCQNRYAVLSTRLTGAQLFPDGVLRVAFAQYK